MGILMDDTVKNMTGKLLLCNMNVSVIVIPDWVVDGWLVGWVLCHINLCRIFNAKSIFYVNNHLYFKQFSCQTISISSYSV